MNDPPSTSWIVLSCRERCKAVALLIQVKPIQETELFAIKVKVTSRCQLLWTVQLCTIITEGFAGVGVYIHCRRG
jgi:hypothetical protein